MDDHLAIEQRNLLEIINKLEAGLGQVRWGGRVNVTSIAANLLLLFISAGLPFTVSGQTANFY